jgi:hypothetical protein
MLPSPTEVGSRACHPSGQARSCTNAVFHAANSTLPAAPRHARCPGFAQVGGLGRRQVPALCGVISLSCRHRPSYEGLAVTEERCPETAVIVMSIPSCRHRLSAPVGPQFRTRIDNVHGRRPVQRYRPLKNPRIRAVPEAFLHVRYFSSAEPEGWQLSRSSCVEIGANAPSEIGSLLQGCTFSPDTSAGAVVLCSQTALMGTDRLRTWPSKSSA